MIRTIAVFILMFTGYLCNKTEHATFALNEDDDLGDLSPSRVGGKHIQNSSRSSTPETAESDHVPARRSLPTLVVAGVSIALVLLFILIVGGFWYAWKKSQEGSIEINPIPYGEAGVSFRSVPVPEN